MASVTYEHVTKRWGDVGVERVGLEHHRDIAIFRGNIVDNAVADVNRAFCHRLQPGEHTQRGAFTTARWAYKDQKLLVFNLNVEIVDSHHMTVYDNMAFGLRLRKTPKDEIDRRVREAAGALGIDHLLDRKPKALSGGQRQRVAVGRAIVREPFVFLMDEPLSNLDAKLRVEARALIQRLHQQLATTFIYVTHDQTEAMTMGSRIAVLKDGILQQIDTPQSLYDDPENVFVAGFIGSPSMNFFDGTMVREDGKLFVDTGSFRVEAPADKVATWSKAPSARVVLGIRPEDMHDPEFAPPGILPFSVNAQVDVTELMGNEVFVYYKLGKAEFIARLDPRTKAHMGTDMQVVFNTERMHLFDAETELAIR